MTKRCYICDKTYNMDNFYKDRSRHDGYSNKCKKCELNRNSDRQRGAFRAPRLPWKKMANDNIKPKPKPIIFKPVKPIKIMRGFKSYIPLFERTEAFFFWLRKKYKILDPDNANDKILIDMLDKK